MAALAKSTDVRIQIEGIQHLLGQLAEVEKAARKAMRTGLAKAGKAVIAKAKPNVPVRFGYLKKSLIVKVNQRGSPYAIVGAENKVFIHEGRKVNPAKYAHLAEEGSQPHPYIRKKKLLGAEVSVKSREGTHPGAKGQPFLIPAYLSTEKIQLDYVATELQKAIDENVK